MTATQADEKTLKTVEDRILKMNARQGPRVGDWLKAREGLYTRFTHKWDDRIQTGGSNASYYLGNEGGLSYSGGLDGGVLLSDLVQIPETKRGGCWIFKDDHHKAHNGYDFETDFRVFVLKGGADESRIDVLKAWKHKQEQDKLPSLMRFNGNGQLYELKIPMIVINTKMNEHDLAEIEKQTGLKFKECWEGFEAQPTMFEQITMLFLCYNFETKYYNNHQYTNTIVLTLKTA